MTKVFVHNKQKVRDMNSLCKSAAFPLIRRYLLTALYSLLHQKRLHLSQKNNSSSFKKKKKKSLSHRCARRDYISFPQLFLFISLASICWICRRDTLSMECLLRGLPGGCRGA